MAISVTVALKAKFAEQMTPPLPQLIAPAPPLTLPLPFTVTVSFGSGANVAVTDRSLFIVSCTRRTCRCTTSLTSP